MCWHFEGDAGGLLLRSGARLRAEGLVPQGTAWQALEAPLLPPPQAPLRAAAPAFLRYFLFTHPPIPGDFIGNRIRRNLALEDPKAAEANALEAQPGFKLGIQNPPKGGLRTPGGIWPHRAASGCLAHL